MKTAYLINCHKNMNHVSRLAHRLHSEDSHVFIHVDKKVSQEIYNSLCSSVADLKYCYVSESRINGKLDDRSLVDIVMVLIADAKKVAKKNNIHYSYYSNMSGQDYLIKPMKTVEELLEKNYPDLYMNYRDTSTTAWVAKKFNRNKALISYRDWALKCNIVFIRKALQGFGVLLRNILKLFGLTASQRIIKNGWNYYQGSAWWVLPDCVIDAIEKEYYSPSKFAKIMIDESTTPEETYFQSMTMHIFFSDGKKIDDADMKIHKRVTYIDFGGETNRPQVCHPYIITMNDYERLCKSNCWFARKFDDTVDSKIIDTIDENLI